MREIKFRAWDKSHQEMLDWVYLITQHSMAIFATSEGYFELMQYTGLEDRNGVEIYEGDIVKCGEPENYEVAWDDIDGTLVLRRPRKPKKAYDWGPRKDGKVYYGFRFSKSRELIEVIGNLYENPELLK